MSFFDSDGQLSASGASVLYQEYVRYWSESRVRHLATGMGLVESDITAMLCALDGPAERALVDHLLQVSGLPPADRSRYLYQVIEPTEVRKNRRRLASGRPSGINPDIVIQRRNHDSNADIELVVAAEVKRGASVNGGAHYCPSGVHADYSNQVVCYVHGCWLSEESPSRNTIRYVWIAPAAHLAPGIFPKSALNGTQRQRDRWGATSAAFNRQTAALELWRTSSLEALADALEDAAPDVSRLVRHWAFR